jgi:hypothetical protein
MAANLEDILVSVWRQVMMENSNAVQLDGRRFPVLQTSRSKLREVNFEFEGQTLRGLEQNPNTKSRWAELARAGKKVMQFLSGGKYVAVVVDGKADLYNRDRGH